MLLDASQSMLRLNAGVDGENAGDSLTSHALQVCFLSGKVRSHPFLNLLPAKSTYKLHNCFHNLVYEANDVASKRKLQAL